VAYKKGSTHNKGCFGALSRLINQAPAAAERHPVAPSSMREVGCWHAWIPQEDFAGDALDCQCHFLPQSLGISN